MMTPYPLPSRYLQVRLSPLVPPSLEALMGWLVMLEAEEAIYTDGYYVASKRCKESDNNYGIFTSLRRLPITLSTLIDTGEIFRTQLKLV